MSKSKQHLVSVILPVYGVKHAYLYKCIKSLLDQTYDNIEVIAIVDPSTREKDLDITYTFDLFRDDHRLKTIYHKQRRGLIYSLNEGIILSKGEVIARADADDFYSKHRLEYQLYFADTEHVAIVGTWAIMVSEDDSVIGKIKLPTTPEDIQRHIIAHNPVINSSTIVAKKVYRDIGLYTQGLEGSEDYEFWLRAIARGYKILNIPYYLTFLRENPESVTRGKKWLRNRLLYIALKVHALTSYPKTYLNIKNILYTLASLSSIITTPQIAIHAKKALKYLGIGYVIEPR